MISGRAHSRMSQDLVPCRFTAPVARGDGHFSRLRCARGRWVCRGGAEMRMPGGAQGTRTTQTGTSPRRWRRRWRCRRAPTSCAPTTCPSPGTPWPSPALCGARPAPPTAPPPRLTCSLLTRSRLSGGTDCPASGGAGCGGRRLMLHCSEGFVASLQSYLPRLSSVHQSPQRL